MTHRRFHCLPAAALLASLAAGRVRASTSPSTTQIDAPSINSASPELLDHPDFPALAGLAWDERSHHGPNRDAATLDVTPSGIAQLVRTAARMESDETRPSGLLSRAAARVTIGGPPQFVDSLRTARARRLTNHVTSELKLRLLDGERPLGPWPARPTALALALTADNLGTGFGLDRYQALLIAERKGSCTWTANTGYRIIERYHSTQRLAETKLGMGAEWRWFALSRGRVPVDVELSSACLLRNHGRATVWQGGALVDIPIVDGLSVSVGGRRSDRPEIAGDDRVRGVLSVAYDLRGLAR